MKRYKVIGTSTTGNDVLIHPADTYEECVLCAEYATNDEYNTAQNIRIVGEKE